MINFEPGKRYRILHKSETQRIERASVMDYLGAKQDGYLSFSARPVAGTQRIPLEWIVAAEEVFKSTPISLNVIIR